MHERFRPYPPIENKTEAHIIALAEAAIRTLSSELQALGLVGLKGTVERRMALDVHRAQQEVERWRSDPSLQAGELPISLPAPTSPAPESAPGVEKPPAEIKQPPSLRLVQAEKAAESPGAPAAPAASPTAVFAPSR